MRLALLGPAEGHAEALGVAARFLFEERPVDRALYLGIDGALDAIVRAWASSLVHDNPTAEGLWARAARACLNGSPEEIDRYIVRERERGKLRIFESLPDADTRAVEMLGGALAVMIHDKATLGEEDMLPARLLIFGKGREAVVKQVGPRWFLSPGSFDENGLMILEDSDDGVVLTLYDRACREVRAERLSTSRNAVLKVGSAGG